MSPDVLVFVIGAGLIGAWWTYGHRVKRPRRPYDWATDGGVRPSPRHFRVLPKHDEAA